jgi:hypothetical protein
MNDDHLLKNGYRTPLIDYLITSFLYERKMDIISNYYDRIYLPFERDRNSSLTWGTNFYNFIVYPNLFYEIDKEIRNIFPGAIISKIQLPDHPTYAFRVVIEFENAADEAEFILISNNIEIRV